MTDPTYALAITPPTVAATTADLLSRFDAPNASTLAATLTLVTPQGTQVVNLAVSTSVAGWPATSPQMRLVVSEAVALQFEQLQRAIIARTCSVSQLMGLQPFLVSQGYSQVDATTIASAWVDVALEWFQLPQSTAPGAPIGRIPAQPAVWSIPLLGSALVPIGANYVIQDPTGQFFVSSNTSPVQLPGPVAFTAQTPGNVTAGTIAAIVSMPVGTSINPAGPQTLITAGRAVETDVQALTRAVARWGILGAGWTIDAFDYWIPTSAPTLTLWLVRDDNPLGPGTTMAVLANAAGPATSGEVAAVQAQMGARNVRPLGSSTFLAVAATLDALTVNMTIKGDGTNPNLQANATAALSAFTSSVIGPAILSYDIVRAAALGGAFTRIDFDNGSGVLTTVPISLPGFTGAGEISSSDMLASHTVPAGAGLVLTPNITVI